MPLDQPKEGEADKTPFLFKVTIVLKSGYEYTALYSKFSLKKNGFGEVTEISWILAQLPNGVTPQILRLQIDEIALIVSEEVISPA